LPVWVTITMLLVGLVAGCAPQGEVIKVTIAPTPAIKDVAHLGIDTVVGNNKRTRQLDFNATTTPISFGIAFPHEYVDQVVAITVTMTDANNVLLGKAVGSTTIRPDVIDLMLTVGAGPSLCDQVTGDALCDGFESGFKPFWKGGVISSGEANTSLTIDDTRAFRGSHSIHIQTENIKTANPVYATLVENQLIPNNVYVRAFVWVPQNFSTLPGGIALFEQDAGAYYQIALNLEQQTLSVFDGIDSSKNLASGQVTKEHWTCVEWSVTVGSSGTTNVWIEDQPVLQQKTVPTIPATGTPLNQIAIGLVNGNAGTEARELWMDEIMIDSQRIHCPN
jgi:hypothetical protein